MSTVDKMLRKISFTDKDNGEDCTREILGYIEFFSHELDGSSTILIRTPARESVQEFIMSEIKTKNITTEQK